jgi:outer membrane lipoprotein SlyB
MAIATQQKAFLYDIQLLPYCPIPNAIQEDGSMYVINNNEFSVVSYKDENDDEKYVSIAFHVSSSKFNTLIEHKVEAAQSAIEKKINNECDKWRLTAPNYSNYFDFSIEKNNGVEYFDVDCIYKPFTPYIHINPNFKGLYGYDDNSPRGLVLGGDFSLDQITDQWLQYQAQNKNFQATFDRQIQNMELNNSIARTQDIVGTIAGALGGAATGGISGGMMATGGKGSIWGAAIGGAASLGAGIADIAINEQLRNEALDYTKDMFGYQLGNIQALPNTISKVSAYNNNNKIFPVLEYYTCTNREKEALLNKIAYNGMTVMAIGKIKDYIGNSWSYNDISSKGYIKGKLIRLETIEDDYHIINELSNELNKGVYI